MCACVRAHVCGNLHQTRALQPPPHTVGGIIADHLRLVMLFIQVAHVLREIVVRLHIKMNKSIHGKNGYINNIVDTISRRGRMKSTTKHT